MGTKPSQSKLVELYHEQDLTQKAVGDELGVSSPTVAKWLREEDIETRKPRDKDLITDLQRVAEEVGKTPSYDQYREHGEYGANTIKRRFDGWNNAIEAAGLTPNTKGTPLAEAELIETLRDLADDLGKSPTQTEINEHTPHTHKTYYRRFDGGLSEAKARAGLKLNQPGDRATTPCENCGAELVRLQSNIAGKENVFCDDDCVGEYRRENYDPEQDPRNKQKEVECRACGEGIYRPRYKVEKHTNFYCSDCWGNATVKKECDECEAKFEIPPALDHQRFCSYQCAGDWRSENITGEDHPRFKDGEFPRYYGPNWRKQRRRARMRDDHTCQKCGLTREESLDEHGEVLSVHHKTPIREFVTDGELDYEQANRLENLVTLCRSCHSITEGNQHSNA